MRGRPLTVGLIGCGRAAETLHLPVLERTREVQVVAATDTDAERARRVAKRFGIPRVYADLGSLLEDSGIAAVAICVPVQFHVQTALAALDAGKHVFIEKPLALDLDEVDQLVARVVKVERKVMVGFNLRWHRLVRAARRAVSANAMGRVVVIATTNTTGLHHRYAMPAWRDRRIVGGGVLIEVAVHHFDLLRFLTGAEVDQVFAFIRSERSDDEAATVALQLSNGVIASLAFADRSYDINEIEVYGEAGRLQLDVYRPDGLSVARVLRTPGTVPPRSGPVRTTLAGVPRPGPLARKRGDVVASYQAEWRHFADCVRRDQPTECTLEDGRRTLEVMLAALASAERGRPVRVGEAPRSVSRLT
jgi:myo-inositol 2-dehydrogenase/D-chiro-inositol 1-dehydrogenase